MILENLSELWHICKGPKYILSLHNLCHLHIKACEKLRAIFSVSISKSLPQLSSLRISDCNELVDIIEESAEDHLHQLCFPKLEQIEIKCCNRLKCLFSISTLSMFPKLRELEIEETSKLEQVFTCKQNDTENMVLEDVFPNLRTITLKSLPMLATICSGINFQNVRRLIKVDDCPKYHQEITSQLQGPSNLDSKNKEKTEEQLFVNSDNAQAVPYMGETSGSSSNLAKEFDDERETSNSTMQLQHEDLAEAKSTIKASHKTNIPFDDDSMGPIMQEKVQEGPISEDVVVATMVAELATRNSSSKLITPLQQEISSSAKHVPFSLFIASFRI
ncbi:uncharacterized protein LOC129317800 isoform X5 [Prosopis cineraria]|uniref:uncharacterized protein LOC129317800 isoform X5 n=1 Tax=Prosopis cineraria TaxID=364024 RepID=UPI00240F1A35|nr:uncharacterized protein LOC129317800 isoform X5 [Prosopis cineraria]